MNNIILADIAGISDNGLVHNFFVVLIVGICIAVIWAVGRFFIGKFKLPELAMTVWSGFFLLVLVIVVINFLLSLIGHGFIAY